MSVRINIAGDFCITPAYLESELLTSGIKELFHAADINIVNLECPVTTTPLPEKIIKHGPHLHTTEKIFHYLQELRVNAVTLANNHILDYGEEAVATTIETCRQHGIKTTGAGKNKVTAGEYLLLEKNGINIAIVNFCENEWSVATEESAGANPLDIIDNLTQLKKAREAADKTILIFHGGNEYYNLPSPRIKKLFRFFADNGADAIISHHAHVISGYEVYNNVPILYGLGNMLFTKKSEEPGWFTGLTAQLTVAANQPVGFKLVPTKQNSSYVLSLAAGEEQKQLLGTIESLSSIIKDDERLKKEWTAAVNKRSAQYLYTFSALPAIPGRYVKSGLRRLGFVNSLLTKKYLTGIINYITCEAHLEMATQVLKKKLYKK